MPKNRERKCRYCYGGIPDGRPRSKYCKDACRVSWHRKQKRKREVVAAQVVEPEHIKKIKELVFAGAEGEMAAIVRSVFDDHVRHEIDLHIKDNLLGMTEVLVDMAPHAIRALEDDLRSEDDYIRSRAYALWFKYIMPMQQKKTDENDTGNVNIVLATPFSERMAEARQELEGEVIDMTGWIECYVCHQTKHPDAMRFHDERSGTTREICTTCLWKKKAPGMRAGEVDDDGNGDV